MKNVQTEFNARNPFIKACGFTREQDIESASKVGINAVGLNFVPTSPRFVSQARAQKLTACARQHGVLAVGVVMNLERPKLEDLVAACSLDVLQLHGDESPEISFACGGLPIIKALSWSGRSEERDLAVAWLSQRNESVRASEDMAISSLRLGLSDGSSKSQTKESPHGLGSSGDGNALSELSAFLVDAYAPGVGGGTGKVAQWELLNPRPAELQAPLILAGGLKPENVAAGIEATCCVGVDTASGVESAPGIKCEKLMAAFASNARAAFARLIPN